MTQTQTNPKQLLDKQDLALHEFVVSDARTFKSKKDTDLISITLVGKKRFTPLPATLYFGKKSFEEIETLIGQTVSFTFSINSSGSIAIQEIYPH